MHEDFFATPFEHCNRTIRKEYTFLSTNVLSLDTYWNMLKLYKACFLNKEIWGSDSDIILYEM